MRTAHLKTAHLAALLLTIQIFLVGCSAEKPKIPSSDQTPGFESAVTTPTPTPSQEESIAQLLKKAELLFEQGVEGKRGALKEAEAKAEEALKLAAGSGVQTQRAHAYKLLARISLKRGSVNRASRYCKHLTSSQINTLVEEEVKLLESAAVRGSRGKIIKQVDLIFELTQIRPDKETKALLSRSIAAVEKTDIKSHAERLEQILSGPPVSSESKDSEVLASDYFPASKSSYWTYRQSTNSKKSKEFSVEAVSDKHYRSVQTEVEFRTTYVSGTQYSRRYQLKKRAVKRMSEMDRKGVSWKGKDLISRASRDHAVLLKAGLEVGESWHYGVRYDKSGDVIHTFRVLATNQKTTVPAGTFECYVVEESETRPIFPNSEPRRIRRYYAPQVGLVKKNISDPLTEDVLLDYKLP